MLRIVVGELSVTAGATEYEMSRQYLHKLLARHRDEGLDGLDARSRAPLSSPQAVTDRVRDRVVELRRALAAAGTDAGPVTIDHPDTGETLATNTIDTARTYRRSTNKSPAVGRALVRECRLCRDSDVSCVTTQHAGGPEGI